MPNWTPETIRALRQSLGLTQLHFAVRLGVSLSTVHSWERTDDKGHAPRGLSAAALDRLAKEAKP